MFTNKSILITGASSGLGRSLAIKLYQQNANLLLMARNLQELEETQRLCLASQSHNSNPPLLVQGDVCVMEDCDKAVKKIIAHHGQIDYLVLNAGISMGVQFEQLTDLTVLRRLMDVNYFGAIQCVYYALPHLKRVNGMIVAISSLQGKMGVPFHTGYAASKHALQGFCDSLRIELARQVAILVVSPTWIKGTNLKKKSVTTNKVASQLPLGISLEYCAQEIIKGMKARKREIILSPKYKPLIWLRFFIPRLLDFLMIKFVKA